MALEVAVAVGLVWLLATGGWRHGWSWLTATVIAALLLVVHLYVVAGFELTEHWDPLSGQDADRYAQWKAVTHEQTETDHENGHP